MSRTVPVISAMWPAGWATPTSTSRWRTSRAIPGWSLASTTSKPPEARCRGRAAPTTAALPRLPSSAGGPRRPAGVHVGVECGRALRVLVVLLPPDLALDPGERQSCVRGEHGKRWFVSPVVECGDVAPDHPAHGGLVHAGIPGEVRAGERVMWVAQRGRAAGTGGTLRRSIARRRWRRGRAIGRG